MKKLKNTLIITTIVLTMMLTGCTSKETKEFQEYLDSSDYLKASNYYSKNKDSIELKDFSEIIKKESDTVIDSFINGNTSLSASSTNLNALKSMATLETEDYINEKLLLLDDIADSQKQYALGDEYYESEDFRTAIEYYSNVIEEDPLYSSAKEKLQQCRSAYEEDIISEADSYAEYGDYTTAIDILNNSIDEFEDIDKISEKISSYEKEYKNILFENAKKYADEGDLKTSIQELSVLISEYPDDTDMKKQYDIYVEQYVSVVIEEANVAVKNKNYDGALKTIDEAMIILPENQQLSAQSEEIIRIRPNLLYDLTQRNSEDFYYSENALTDIDGNTYPANNLFYTYDGSGWSNYSCSEFNLNKEYMTFTATLAPKSNFSQNGDVMIEIYGDDVLINAYTIYQKTEAFEINVDVSGIKWLKIKAIPVNQRDLYCVGVIIADGEFFKQTQGTSDQKQSDKTTSQTGTVTTQEDALNVRKSPSKDAEKIGTVSKGSTVTIVSTVDGWYQIQYNNGTGYVAKEYITIN